MIVWPLLTSLAALAASGPVGVASGEKAPSFSLDFAQDTGKFRLEVAIRTGTVLCSGTLAGDHYDVVASFSADKDHQFRAIGRKRDDGTVVVDADFQEFGHLSYELDPSGHSSVRESTVTPDACTMLQKAKTFQAIREAVMQMLVNAGGWRMSPQASQYARVLNAMGSLYLSIEQTSECGVKHS